VRDTAVTSGRREPRTLTLRLRLRTLCWALAALAVTSAVAGFLVWASSLAPLTTANAETQVHGTAPLRHTADGSDTGPPVYRWRRGATYTYLTWFRNTTRLPVTITGVDSTPRDWVGAIAGPRPLLYRDAVRMAGAMPFRPVRLAPGDEVGIGLVYRANPNACGQRDATMSIAGAKVRFSVLGLFRGSQWLALGQPLVMAFPGPSHCR
jgi:hypothetical protein